MPIPYSNDLRKKVIDLINGGMQQKEVARLLSINKSTIFRWNKEYKEKGSCDFKGYNHNKDKIKSDFHEVRKIVEENPHYTLHMIATMVGNVSHQTISNILKKLGYSFKKTHGYIKSEMSRQDKSL